MKHWLKSEINHELHLLVHFTQTRNADGMPRLEPQLLGFIHLRQSRIWYACVYHPDPVEIPVTPSMRIFEAKKAVETAIQNRSKS